MNFKFFQTKIKSLNGSSYRELYSKAKFIYNNISSNTKRRPYVRSSFFDKEKVFMDTFWIHLMDKNKSDRIRRLRLYACAIDLIKYSKYEPITKNNPNKKNEIVHRFMGINGNNELFYVQIKEDRKSGEKSFVSVFP